MLISVILFNFFKTFMWMKCCTLLFFIRKRISSMLVNLPPLILVTSVAWTNYMWKDCKKQDIDTELTTCPFFGTAFDIRKTWKVWVFHRWTPRLSINAAKGDSNHLNIRCNLFCRLAQSDTKWFPWWPLMFTYKAIYLQQGAVEKNLSQKTGREISKFTSTLPLLYFTNICYL